MKTYTDRVIEKLISSDGHHKKVGCWHEGKFYVAWADQSKSRMGVKYNRLIRLSCFVLVKQDLEALADTLLIEEKQ